MNQPQFGFAASALFTRWRPSQRKAYSETTALVYCGLKVNKQQTGNVAVLLKSVKCGQYRFVFMRIYALYGCKCVGLHGKCIWLSIKAHFIAFLLDCICNAKNKRPRVLLLFFRDFDPAITYFRSRFLFVSLALRYVLLIHVAVAIWLVTEDRVYDEYDQAGERHVGLQR